MASFDYRTARRAKAIWDDQKRDNELRNAAAKGEKPQASRTRTKTYADEGKEPKTTGRISNESRQKMNDYLNRLGEQKNRIPAAKRKKIEENARRREQQASKDRVNGMYRENLMNATEYDKWMKKTYKGK